MITTILGITALVVGAIIGYFIGADSLSTTTKQQSILQDKITDLQKTVEDKVTTS